MKYTHHNIEMHYTDRGQGEAIILIHGYPLGRKMWTPQIEAFSQNMRVIAPDLRGFGESGIDPTVDIHTMDLLADDCAALLDHLGINEQVNLCGLSMGGYISFAFMRKYPKRVKRLVLASTRALPDSPETGENRLKAATLAEKEGAEAITCAMLPVMLSPHTHKSKAEVVADVAGNHAKGFSARDCRRSKGMRLRPDSTPLLGEIRVPTLILRGDDDGFAPVEEAEAMRDGIADAQLVRIPQAAHLPNLEQVHIFNQALQKFIQTI